EIEAFKPEEYWKVIAYVAPEGATHEVSGGPVKVRIVKSKKKIEADPDAPPADGQPSGQVDVQDVRGDEAPAAPPEGSFPAELAEWAGKKFEAKTEEETTRITTALEKANYVVAKVEQKDRAERPAAPFTTSTLQQQSSIRLHYSAKRTMMLDQRLYEGVEL